MLQELEPLGAVEIDHAEQKEVVRNRGQCFLERAGPDRRIPPGCEEVPQATVHHRVCPDNKDELILGDVSFHVGCRSSARARRILATLARSARSSSSSLRSCSLSRSSAATRALSCSWRWAVSSNLSTRRCVFSNQRAISAPRLESKGRVLARSCSGPWSGSGSSPCVGDVKVTTAQAVPTLKPQ